MKVSTVPAPFIPALRTLAEREDTVAAVATTAGSGSVQIGGHAFTLLGQLPAPEGLAAKTPIPKDAFASSVQIEQLKIVTRDCALPGIKMAFPGTADVITGVQVVWAGKDFWELVNDPGKDGTQKVIGGVKLLSSAVGFGLSLAQAPPAAQNLNTFMGLVVATADKIYTVRLEADEVGAAAEPQRRS